MANISENITTTLMPPEPSHASESHGIEIIMFIFGSCAVGGGCF